MMKVTNSNGTEIDFDAAVELMDEEIQELLHFRLYGNEQEFFDAYVIEHEKRFGVEFGPNKATPVW